MLFGEIPLRESIVQQTITLRQQHRLKVPDAVIGASALDADLPLVTRNLVDFSPIDD